MKSYIYTFLIFIFVLSNALFAFGSQDGAVSNKAVFELVLDMYRNDFYLVGMKYLNDKRNIIDNMFNYWMYTGLGYERTGQVSKAINAYKKAIDVKSDSSALGRLNNLKSKTKQSGFFENNLMTDVQKGFYSMGEAKRMRFAGNNRKAFWLFLQSLEFDDNFLVYDEGFIGQGQNFYRKVSEDVTDAERYLLLGIFSLLSGELKQAQSNFNRFDNSTDTSPTLSWLANKYKYKLSKEKEQTITTIARTREPVKETEVVAVTIREDEPRQRIHRTQSHISTDNYARANNISTRYIFAEQSAMQILEELSEAHIKSDRAKLIRHLGETGSQNIKVMNFLLEELDPNDSYYSRTVFDAINRIGGANSKYAVDYILNLKRSSNRPFRALALERLAVMGIEPQKVMPVIIDKYTSSSNRREQALYANYAANFGYPGLEALYDIIENQPRAQRRPTANLISALTGEDVDRVVNLRFER